MYNIYETQQGGILSFRYYFTISSTVFITNFISLTNETLEKEKKTCNTEQNGEILTVIKNGKDNVAYANVWEIIVESV